jgi:hypothetical protein
MAFGAATDVGSGHACPGMHQTPQPFPDPVTRVAAGTVASAHPQPSAAGCALGDQNLR